MIDVQEAQQFLSALSSHDDGTIFSFQTLYDVKPEHDVSTRIAEEKRLTRVIHGRFEDVVDELIEPAQIDPQPILAALRLADQARHIMARMLAT